MKRILKNTLLFFAIFTIFGCGKGQDFRGYIEYEVKTQKVDLNFTNDEFLKGFGDKSIFYYDDGSYFQTHSNSTIEFGFLDSKEKKSGLKFIGNDTLYFYNATKLENEKLISIEKSTSTKKILQYDCLRVDLHSQNLAYNFNQTIIFYYSDKIKIDGRKFDGIKIQFSNEVYGKLNSIPLSIEIQNPIYTLTFTATKIVNSEKVSVSELIKNSTKGLIIKRMN